MTGGAEAPRPRRRLAYGVVAVYVLAMAAVVFSPIQWWLNRLTVRIYVIVRYDLHGPDWVLPETVGAALNVLLFVPLGALLVALWRVPWPVAALAAVIVSAGIELAQGLPLLARQPSLVDVAANGLGGLLGALLVVGVRWWWRRR